MPDPSATPGTVPVVDRRPVPRGVLPRGAQTWLMAALALGMMLIILLTGRPDAPQADRAAAPPAQTPTADRVRDYQERLRILDERAAKEARDAALAQPTLPPSLDNDARPTKQVDPTVAERRRKDYESLFASNVVLSRRPDDQRPDSGRRPPASLSNEDVPQREEPSIDA